MIIVNFDTSIYCPVQTEDERYFAYKIDENPPHWEEKDEKIVKCFPIMKNGELNFLNPTEYSRYYLYSLPIQILPEEEIERLKKKIE